MRQIAGPFLSVIAAALGCASSPPLSGPPPIEIAIRDSVVGRGKVIRLTNTGERQLQLISLELKGEEKEFRGVVAKTLHSHDTTEIGWAELGFPIKTGMTLRVTCKEFPEAVEDTVK